MRREIAFWVGLALLVVLCIGLALSGLVGAQLATTVILAVATLTYASVLFWEHWVSRPELKIYIDEERKALHEPQLTYFYISPPDIIQRTCDRRYLRVQVENKGGKVAKNCAASLEVVSRPNRCPAPADEPKGLKWAGRGAFQLMDIYPKGGRAVLDVAFSEQDLHGSWHMQGKWGPLVAWLATHEASIEPRLRAQDALCKGEYKVDIIVGVDNGTPAKSSFRLEISEDWHLIHIYSE